MTERRIPRPDAGDEPRDRLILDHLGLVREIARRYAGRGVPLDDLMQVGAIGLIKAASRFDASRGNTFASYAAPTILGEIRRHFRDRGWALQVPRRLKDLSLRVGRRVDDLVTQLGRQPTVKEIAEAEEISEEEVLEALEASYAYAPQSLSAPAPGDDAEQSWMETLGDVDPGFDTSELRTDLGQGFRALDARERQIMLLSFRDGLVQSEIAAIMGISQMHVSRLIRRSILKMREAMEA